MELLKYAYKKYNTLSVVGMAKNAGKTVTLNRLIEEAAEAQVKLGITSTGRDGERLDLVTSTEKPTIYIHEGTLVATAAETLLASQVKLEILEVTNFNTALGQVVIARALDSGLVEIAGPTTNHQIKVAAEMMKYFGAELILVDGAINRKTAAAPSITEGTILATGAVISRNINKAIEDTLHQVRLFNLPVVEDHEMSLLARGIIEEKTFAVINQRGEITYLDIATSLNTGIIIGDAIKENSTYIIISGSLTKKTLEDIIAVSPYYKNVKIIIKDGTRVFLNSKDWGYFLKRGISLEVLDKINVLAVTINPVAPSGYSFNPRDFKEKMQEALRPIPVVDVVMEEL
ncbi:hypothetical protein F8153_02150 [Alkaliphilus serpentinus]|uniref:Uncharacterized protein n=2 Tax=Alkaliphilus serpentinus TaxID=1482731 RepID=A0A833HQZ3_9FIRM|nr:hypothetical protein F8153_02150 [Alkaliphilus serpentinus]